MTKTIEIYLKMSDFGKVLRSLRTKENTGLSRRDIEILQREKVFVESRQRIAIPKNLSRTALYGAKNQKKNRRRHFIDYSLFALAVFTVGLILYENQLFFENDNESSFWNYFLRTVNLFLTLISVVLIHFKYKYSDSTYTGVEGYHSTWNMDSLPNYLLEVAVHL